MPKLTPEQVILTETDQVLIITVQVLPLIFYVGHFFTEYNRKVTVIKLIGFYSLTVIV